MILERYLMRSVVLAAAGSVVGLVVVLVAVQLAEQAGLLAAEADPLVALRLSGLLAVVQGYQMLPLGGFFATLIAGAFLAQRGELLGMVGGGLRPRRMWAAFAAVLAGLAVVGMLWGELAAPAADVALQRLFQTELHKGPGRLNAFFSRRHPWFAFGDLVLYLPAPPRGGEPVFADPTVYRFADGLVAEVTEALTLSHTDQGWVLEGARVYPEAAAPSPLYARLPLALHASPVDLMDVAGNPRQLGSLEVWRLVERRARAGFDTTPHRVELYGRAAHPWLGLFLFLVAAPWVLDPTRRRSLAMALGAGVIVLALALGCGQLLRILALSGALPAPLGAWGVPVACLGLAPVARWWHRRRAGG